MSLTHFISCCAAAGFDGIILPDLPMEEAGEVVAAAESAGMCHIGLVAPTTSAARPAGDRPPIVRLRVPNGRGRSHG
jgi:tryptophan synthase alpha chain